MKMPILFFQGPRCEIFVCSSKANDFSVLLIKGTLSRVDMCERPMMASTSGLRTQRENKQLGTEKDEQYVSGLSSILNFNFAN